MGTFISRLDSVAAGSQDGEVDTIQAKMQTAFHRLSATIEATRPIAVFGLFSGGHDSVCATAIAAMHSEFTSAVHINTGFGVERTRQYVRETAALKAWPLKEYEAAKNVNAKGEPDPKIYRDLVLRYGFPGPAAHGAIYTLLKERCLQRMQRECGASGNVNNPRRVMCVSGARTEESKRRMANTEEVQIDGQRIWCAPIHDWSKHDTSELMECLGIPRNPVVDLIHKSGECLCGAFAERGELAELALWPETQPIHAKIIALEKEVLDAGFPWGWEEGPPSWWTEQKRGQTFLLEYDKNEPQHLCWSCNRRREGSPSRDEPPS